MMQVRKEASLVVVIVVIAMVVVVDSVVVAGCRGCSSRGGVVLVMLFAECTRFTAEIRFFSLRAGTDCCYSGVFVCILYVWYGPLSQSGHEKLSSCTFSLKQTRPRIPRSNVSPTKYQRSSNTGLDVLGFFRKFPL